MRRSQRYSGRCYCRSGTDVPMPKGLTAATGMDALTHAIESYITPSMGNVGYVRTESHRNDCSKPESSC